MAFENEIALSIRIDVHIIPYGFDDGLAAFLFDDSVLSGIATPASVNVVVVINCNTDGIVVAGVEIDIVVFAIAELIKSALISPYHQVGQGVGAGVVREDSGFWVVNASGRTHIFFRCERSRFPSPA